MKHSQRNKPTILLLPALYIQLEVGARIRSKNERNIRERGLSFERVADFDFETAIYLEDRRHEYGERRIRSLGYIERWPVCTRLYHSW